MTTTSAVTLQPTASVDINYEVARSLSTPYEWNVEAINYAGDGEIYAATFSGPKAYERALEYAAWKNGSLAESHAPEVALMSR